MDKTIQAITALLIDHLVLYMTVYCQEILVHKYQYSFLIPCFFNRTAFITFMNDHIEEGVFYWLLLFSFSLLNTSYAVLLSSQHKNYLCFQPMCIQVFAFGSVCHNHFQDQKGMQHGEHFMLFVFFLCYSLLNSQINYQDHSPTTPTM